MDDSDETSESRENAKPKRRVNWRNVAILCVIQFPIWYWASGFIEPPCDAPRVTSPEGRRVFREWVARTFPELFSGTAVTK